MLALHCLLPFLQFCQLYSANYSQNLCHFVLYKTCEPSAFVKKLRNFIRTQTIPIPMNIIEIKKVHDFVSTFRALLMETFQSYLTASSKQLKYVNYMR